MYGALGGEGVDVIVGAMLDIADVFVHNDCELVWWLLL